MAGRFRDWGYRDGRPSDARFYRPAGLALAADGTIIVADCANNRIRSVSPQGTMLSTQPNTTQPLRCDHSGGQRQAGQQRRASIRGLLHRAAGSGDWPQRPFDGDRHERATVQHICPRFPLCAYCLSMSLIIKDVPLIFLRIILAILSLDFRLGVNCGDRIRGSGGFAR